MTGIMREDALRLASDEGVPWDWYAHKTVVVTGATGLIGTALVQALLRREEQAPSGLRVVALVRNVAKAHERFGDAACLTVLPWDATSPDEGLQAAGHADLIVHAANMTDSAAFVERPVDVIRTTVGGTRAMLDLAKATNARLCLLSTMETYGEIGFEGRIREDQGGFLDAMVVRNSYPEAKRLDEALCAAYASQYGVHAMVIRLSQTFGPGVPADDNRVFAYFARCVRGGEDIVLLTQGTKRNAYLYTADAVSAILCASARGEAGRAYNAANDATFCAVRDMAQLVATRFGGGHANVRFELDEAAASRFRKGSVLRMDTTELEALGWRAHVGLEEMYERLMADWDEREQASRSTAAEQDGRQTRKGVEK